MKPSWVDWPFINERRAFVSGMAFVAVPCLVLLIVLAVMS